MEKTWKVCDFYKVFCAFMFMTSLRLTVCMNVTEMKGAFNTTYSQGIDKNNQILFIYRGESYFNNSENIANIKLRIRVETNLKSSNLTKISPLLFTIWQKQAITSTQLPVHLTNDEGLNLETFNMVERTLCFDPRDPWETKDIKILVFTSCTTAIKFTLSVQATADYIIPVNKTLEMSISSVSTNFYYFDFPKFAGDLATIRIRSDNRVCMLVSVQPPNCPALDSDSNVEFKGFWSTVTTMAGISVRKDEFQRGFLLVFVIPSNPSRCSQYGGIIRDRPPETLTQRRLYRFPNGTENPRIKKVYFDLQLEEKVQNAALPILLPLLLYVIFIVLILIVFAYFHRAKHEIVASAVAGESRPIVDSNPSDEKLSGLQKFKRKLQSPVRISELVKMDLKRLERKSKRFYWSIIIVAVFYFVPVCQLAFTYLKVLHRTGERDLCYYNYLCAQRWGNLLDFNHIYSNVGFCILGLIFIILVRIKHSNLKNSDQVDDSTLSTARFFKEDLHLEMNVGAGLVKNEEIKGDKEESSSVNSSLWDQVFPTIDKSRKTGILYHFGLFYALGIALVMEGLLSAAYHICPNQTNFQYDTSFMYVISVLYIIKLYQFRHPIYVNANVTFGCLAVIAVWAVFGLKSESKIFKAAFTIFHFFCVFNFLIFQYYIGYLIVEDEPVTSLWQVYKYLLSKLTHFLKNKELKTFHRQTLRRGMAVPAEQGRRNRAILPTLSIIMNVVIMIYNVFTQNDFASQVLAILILNLVMYFSYYAIMKFVHNEYKQGMWAQSLIYTIISLALWIPSLYYFQKASTSWQGSPAESREKNSECAFLGYYDGHDLWHFLSAGALFSSFMTLLTIDDDLVGTSKDNIPVF